MEILVALLVSGGIFAGFGIKWLAGKNKANPVPVESLPPAGYYKRTQREKDFREWNNEYISILQDAFLSQYKIPHEEAKLASVAYSNYVSAKKVIDKVGDRAYWLDECPRAKNPYSNSYEDNMSLARKKSKKYSGGLYKGGNLTLGMLSGRSEPTTTVTRDYISTDRITASMITADKITVGTPQWGVYKSCTCESCNYSANMDRLTHCERVWHHTLTRIRQSYPEFVFENLPKELPELSV